MFFAPRCVVLLVLLTASYAFELPAGLRPAKAVGDETPPILPVAEQEQEQPTTEAADQKTPPNLSLRSRMMAAMASKEKEEKEKAKDSPTTDAAAKPPVIFHKTPKKTNKTPNVSPAKNTQYRINLPAPPSNKNYGVNTLLQTNLVDSKGRVMKGVNVVPIRVPGSAEMKNAKGSHATASQVESEAENVVPIRFGKAGGRK